MREFKGDWRDLFFGFRIALDLRKIFLGLVGSIFSAAGLLVILFIGVAADKGREFTDIVMEGEVDMALYNARVWADTMYVAPVKRLFLPAPRPRVRRLDAEGPPPRSFRNCPAYGLLMPTPIGKDRNPVWPVLILIAGFMWLVFVWSKFGGAIARIAAVEVAKDERITTHEGMLYAKKKYSSYFWSPVSVLIAFLFFYLVNALGGLVGQIPYAGPLLVGLFSIFAFLGGFIMLLIAIGGIFGWPLMAPAVAAEGTDAFDAVSRAFSYIYSRPWQYTWYWLVSLVYGAVSVAFVWIFTLLMVNLTFASAQFGMGRKLDDPIRALFDVGSGRFFEGLDVTQIIMTVILGVIVLFLYGLAVSYAVSFCYSARTLMYFILRKRVDNTEMSEVYLEEEEEDLFEDDFDLEQGKEGPGEKADEACAEPAGDAGDAAAGEASPAAGAGEEGKEEKEGGADTPAS